MRHLRMFPDVVVVWPGRGNNTRTSSIFNTQNVATSFKRRSNSACLAGLANGEPKMLGYFLLKCCYR